MIKDDIAYCPYNREHIISKTKFYSHLGRCKDAKKDGRKTLGCKKDSSVRFFNLEEHKLYCNYCRSQFEYPNESDISMIKSLKPLDLKEDSGSVILDLDISLQESVFSITENEFNLKKEESNFISPEELASITFTKIPENKTILY